MEKLVKVKHKNTFRSWAISTFVALAVIVIIDIISVIFDIELTFAKGWFSCATYFIVLKYEHKIENEIELEELKSNNKELEENNKYLHIRVEALNSQLTTERCIGHK